MSFRNIAGGIVLILMLAACGSSTPAASTAPTAAASVAAAATPASSQADSTAPSTAPGVSLPALPSFVGDPDLAAKFPAQVDGKPVTNVTTARLVDFFTAFSTPQAQIDTTKQALAGVGIDLNTVIVGNAQANANGSSVGIAAVRAPGQDASKMIAVTTLLSGSNSGDKVTQESVGGKTVSVVRDAGGYASSWLYATGDILWSVNTSDQKQAEAVFSALP